MRKISRIFASLTAAMAMAAAGSGQAHADDNLLGLLSPLLCGVQNNVNGDNNQFNQATSCHQTATTTTPPANNGIPGYEVVSEPFAVFNNGIVATDVDCPTGKHVIGGGASADDSGIHDIHVLESGPTPDQTAWRVTVQALDGAPTTNGHFYAICATTS
ncbi:hypothetical protein [Streptomyces sp. NPDC012888]|uniref:hypothetical protein n=1 Tax=Streptomyces sp. NPDC012888 TaxID=3364855 RepID=UPI0036935291